jgi:nucleoid-associated protein YgaU
MSGSRKAGPMRSIPRTLNQSESAGTAPHAGLRDAGALGSRAERSTMGHVESFLAHARNVKPVPVDASRYDGITTSIYVLGTEDPYLKPDKGAGEWNQKAPTLKMQVVKRVMMLLLGQGARFMGGEDAAKHLRHYFSNEGGKVEIDLEKMVREVGIAKAALDKQLKAAKAFVETLPVGTHQFTSQTGSRNHAIGMVDSKNWFFAVASYSTWGKGTAVVRLAGGVTEYKMDFDYKMYDRYNWDGGKSVVIPPSILKDRLSQSIDEDREIPLGVDGVTLTNMGLHVTDKAMGEFHRMGLAKEFDAVGALHRVEKWTGTAKPREYVVKPNDTLGKIAAAIYGDANQWKRIHTANLTTVPNPDLIKPGLKLKIPWP